MGHAPGGRCCSGTGWEGLMASPQLTAVGFCCFEVSPTSWNDVPGRCFCCPGTGWRAPILRMKVPRHSFAQQPVHQVSAPLPASRLQLVALNEGPSPVHPSWRRPGWRRGQHLGLDPACECPWSWTARSGWSFTQRGGRAARGVGGGGHFRALSYNYAVNLAIDCIIPQ